MAVENEGRYWVPEHVRAYLRGLGFRLPIEDMEPHIAEWDDWMRARGSFYDYHDVDGFGRVYQVHRRTIMPAMRVCREWGSLLLNEKTSVVCDTQGCTDFLDAYFRETRFMPSTQTTIVRAFGLGTGAFALWFDLGRRQVKIRHYDARMIVPLTWDMEGVSECAFVTRAYYRGKPVDQLQMHLRGESVRALGLMPEEDVVRGSGYARALGVRHVNGSDDAFAGGSGRVRAGGSILTHDPLEQDTYHIVTVCFDEEGNQVRVPGVVPAYDTGSVWSTFAIVKPAVPNTRVDMSPYGQSVFADAIDAVQSVDLAYDAIMNEVDVSKMRVFLSDVMFDREESGGKSVPIPFGRGDCTVFRKVMSTEDTIQEFAPALRTSSQVEAFRIALQMLGDLCGFGIRYFDIDEGSGYVKTATEVASDTSALMRNIRKNENQLQLALCTIARALMACERSLGNDLPEEGQVDVTFDDSIVQDTQSEKQQDMAEVGVTMQPWEYRMKWYGEDEPTARSRAEGLDPKGGAAADAAYKAHAIR